MLPPQEYRAKAEAHFGAACGEDGDLEQRGPVCRRNGELGESAATTGVGNLVGKPAYAAGGTCPWMWANLN